MSIVQIANVRIPQDLARVAPKELAKVNSWENSKSPKAQSVVRSWAKENNVYIESVYQPDTRSYGAYMYRTAAERSACFNM